MAGTQAIGEASDNPVAVNVIAMVDVIFCLCIFFMCSFHFKQLEGKIDTWLPDKYGVNKTPIKDPPELTEIRVFMRWDPATRTTIRKVGSRDAFKNDTELQQIVQQMTNDHKKAGKMDPPVKIDATDEVPWKDVVHVVDLCKTIRIDRLEFVAPWEHVGAAAPAWPR
jgi:biopolymer transport protein ExbD